MNNVASLDYQRVVVGYHGTDRGVVEDVLLRQRHLEPSSNDWDWLGAGIYFWEFGPKRALAFANEQKGRGKVEAPAVLGAYINLGRCFDLTDVEHTDQLLDAYANWIRSFEENQREAPENQSGTGSSSDDLLLRFRDCAVLNWYMDVLDRTHGGTYYQSVRGVFVEGPEAFEGSAIRTKTHVQVAIRDPACVLGYFLPTSLF